MLTNNLGNPNNRVIVPLATNDSALLARISVRGQNQMPPLASNLVDTQGIALVAAWINHLTGYETFAQWQAAFFGATNAPGAGPSDDPDDDGAENLLEYLTGTNPTNSALADAWAIDIGLSNGMAQIAFERVAEMGFEAQVTTNIMDETSWQPLDVPDNMPLFSFNNMPAVISDLPMSETTRFFRVRVYEP